MRKKLRISTSFLAVILALSMLIGCSDSPDNGHLYPNPAGTSTTKAFQTILSTTESSTTTTTATEATTVTTTITTTNATTTKVTTTTTRTTVTTTTRKTTTTHEDVPVGDVVYITPTGKRYHLDSDCGGKNSTPSTLEHAQQIGLTPCKKCAQ